MAESDQHHIRQCLDGHPDEFRHLVRRYQAMLLAYLSGKLESRNRAEEAAQETFVRAYFGLSELKKPGSFYSWLLGIASRVAKEQSRNQKQFCRPDCLAQQEASEPKTSDDYKLEQAIAELPDSYREIILLRFYASQSCSQIAEKLDTPIGTVTKQLSRAYAKLRQSLQREGSGEKEVQE